jgi:hypothetical protein
VAPIFTSVLLTPVLNLPAPFEPKLQVVSGVTTEQAGSATGGLVKVVGAVQASNAFTSSPFRPFALDGTLKDWAIAELAISATPTNPRTTLRMNPLLICWCVVDGLRATGHRTPV